MTEVARAGAAAGATGAVAGTAWEAAGRAWEEGRAWEGAAAGAEGGRAWAGAGLGAADGHCTDGQAGGARAEGPAFVPPAQVAHHHVRLEPSFRILSTWTHKKIYSARGGEGGGGEGGEGTLGILGSRARVPLAPAPHHDGAESAGLSPLNRPWPKSLMAAALKRYTAAGLQEARYSPLSPGWPGTNTKRICGGRRVMRGGGDKGRLGQPTSARP